MKEIKEYYSNGILKRIYFVDDKKSKQGKSIEFYQNGQTFYETEFLDNKEHGSLIIYEKDGEVRQIGEHRYGKRHGMWFTSKNNNQNTFYINGKSCEEDDFKDFILKERLGLGDNKQTNE